LELRYFPSQDGSQYLPLWSNSLRERFFFNFFNVKESFLMHKPFSSGSPLDTSSGRILWACGRIQLLKQLTKEQSGDTAWLIEWIEGVTLIKSKHRWQAGI
jgi:hypothetical protein